ncbi:DUF5753 domain-containing protein [Streptomyces sp. NPDC048504]|uniref:DUF5753 domain-containing protein n=1 Tax=Streptomyces sp. NPDC048504 TaxID=3365559 RepID=UPI00371DB766
MALLCPAGVLTSGDYRSCLDGHRCGVRCGRGLALSAGHAAGRGEVTEQVDAEGESGRAVLGRTLRYLREKAGKSLGQLAEDEMVEEQVAARLGRQYVLRQKPSPDVRIIMDEVAFRRPAARAKTWHDQLLHVETVAMLPNVTLQVLPFSAGVHHHMTGSLTLLWQKDGSAVAYEEGDDCSQLDDDPDDVLRLRLSYDRLRDLALYPPDSLAFIRAVLKEHRRHDAHP